MIDISDVDIVIEGKSKAKDGLAKRRRKLEAVIAPFATSIESPNAFTFLFKGKRKYLRTVPEVASKEWSALMALQFLYKLEAALQADDSDKAARMAIGFCLNDHDVQAFDIAGTDAPSAVMSTAKRKAGSSKGGEAKSKWRKLSKEAKNRAQNYVNEQCRGNKKTSFTGACRRAAKTLGLDIGERALRENLVDPR